MHKKCIKNPSKIHQQSINSQSKINQNIKQQSINKHRTPIDKSLGCTYHNVFHVPARSSVGTKLQAVGLLLSIKMAAEHESSSITPTIPDEEAGDQEEKKEVGDKKSGGGKASNADGKGAKAGKASGRGGRPKRARSNETDPKEEKAGKKKDKAPTVLRKPAKAAKAAKAGKVSKKPATRADSAKPAAGGVDDKKEVTEKNAGRQSGKAATGYQRLMEMSKDFQKKMKEAKDIVFCLSMPWFVLIERTCCSCTAASSY